MPNWVYNDLTVRLPAVDAENFKAHVGGKMYPWMKDEILCAHKIIPYPKEHLDRDIECHNLGEGWHLICKKCGKKMLSKDATSAKKAIHDLVHQKGQTKVGPVGEKFKITYSCPDCQGEAVGYQDGFNSGGYEWCTQNWGTKWGFCHSELVNEGTRKGITLLQYKYDTAWSPASRLLAALAKQFPQAEIEVAFEEETGWKGSELYKKGRLKRETFEPEPEEVEDDEDEDLVPMNKATVKTGGKK